MKERIPYLLDGWMKKKLTEEEQLEWNRLLKEESLNETFKDVLDEVWFTKELNDKMKEEAAGEIFNRITGAKVIKLRRRMSWVKWAAAACILLVTGYVLWVASIRKPESGGQKTEIAKTNDIPAPSNSRAVITLADGSKVNLDSAGNGILAQQNNVAVVKNEKGEIVYSVANSEQRTANSLVYNTLSNPRGSKVISLTLSDGTKVWLNSESSLHYPAFFAPSAVNRTVEITGEAYFEVAHNASKPFHVKKGETDVTVLGTHFNVNAYDDEEALRVTLLEGSVKVSTSNNSNLIKPGQQAKAVNGVLSVESDVDTDEVMAWKNGKFSFNKADIKTVMRQIARWYDLEVVYEGEVTTAKFWGDIQRDLPLSETLSFLKESKVKFEIQGKKVTIKK